MYTEKKYLYKVTWLNGEVEYTSDYNQAIILQNRLGGQIIDFNS